MSGQGTFGSKAFAAHRAQIGFLSRMGILVHNKGRLPVVALATLRAFIRSLLGVHSLMLKERIFKNEALVAVGAFVRFLFHMCSYPVCLKVLFKSEALVTI